MGRGDTSGVRAAEILSYFLRNPETADTVEGIARWRLLQQRVFAAVEEAQEAIEWLVMQHYLLRCPAPGTAPLYGINPDKRRQAEEFLKGRDGERPSLEISKVEIELKNRSPYLMIVTLNSGKTLHLAPNQISEAIDDLEVNGNPKVQKLTKSGQLSVHVVEHQQVGE